MKKLYVLSFALIILLLSLLTLGCLQSQIEENAGEETITYLFSIEVFDASGNLILSESKEVQSGISAFDAMKDILVDDFEYESYAFGPLVKSINGIVPGENQYWALYVNDEYSMRGISDYTLDSNMKVKWIIEDINFDSFG